jgi:hypothetical protein
MSLNGLEPSVSLHWSMLTRAHVPRHCRFRSIGAESVRESGMKWMSGSATRQCGRTLLVALRRRGIALGFGRIFALYYHSSTSYHIHEEVQCLYFLSDNATEP